MREYEQRLLHVLIKELSALRQEIHTGTEKSKLAEQNEIQFKPLQIEVTSSPPPPQAVREYYDAQNQDRKSPWRKVKPWADSLGVIVPFVLGVVTLLTLLEIKKQTPAVIMAANATTNSANIAKAALDVTNRAYLAIDTIEETFSDQPFPVLSVSIINYGHISSKGVSGTFDYIRSSNVFLPKPLKTVIDHRTTNFEDKKVVIVPGQASAFSIDLRIPGLSATDRDAVSSGRQIIAVIGSLEYDDGFGIKDHIVICLNGAKGGRWMTCPRGVEVRLNEDSSKKKE